MQAALAKVFDYKTTCTVKDKCFDGRWPKTPANKDGWVKDMTSRIMAQSQFITTSKRNHPDAMWLNRIFDDVELKKPPAASQISKRPAAASAAAAADAEDHDGQPLSDTDGEAGGEEGGEEEEKEEDVEEESAERENQD